MILARGELAYYAIVMMRNLCLKSSYLISFDVKDAVFIIQIQYLKHKKHYNKCIQKDIVRFIQITVYILD